jgi:hypothetical protein
MKNNRADMLYEELENMLKAPAEAAVGSQISRGGGMMMASPLKSRDGRLMHA